MYIHAYLDYVYWMNHVDVNVHHGGAGAAFIAVKAGKPMVIIPFNADQPLIATLLSE